MSNFFNKTPYTDFHELNLDWLLERVNNIKDHVKGMQDDIIYLQEHTPDMDDYYDKTETDTLLATKANVSDLPDMTDYYDKIETDALLADKANVSDLPDMTDYYDKTETDTLLNAKANVSDLPDMTDYYDKTETDALLANKANVSDLPDMDNYYDKTETDALLADKADVSDLPDMTDYYDKTETDALLNDKANISSLATVATTGNYNDLSNRPRTLKEYYQNWSVPILAGNEYTDVTLNFQQSYQTIPLVHFQVRTSTGDRGNVPVAVIYSLTATTVVIRVWRQVGANTSGGIVPAIDIFIYE